MAGRPRKPSNIHKLKGTYRKDRSAQNEPQPEIRIPDAPDHLSKYALIEWGRITSQLINLGLLTEIDRTELAMYCQAYGRLVKYEKIVEEKGELYKTASGAVQLSPAMWVVNKAMEQCHKFLTEFGCTPASRTKVSAKKADQKSNDPFVKLEAIGK